MNKTFKTNKKPFILGLDFISNQPVNVKIEAQDTLSPFTYYCKKEVKVNGSNKFKVKLPNTPNDLIFKIYPASYESYKDYLLFGKNVPKKFKITKTEVLSNNGGSATSRYMQSIAEDAIIIYD